MAIIGIFTKNDRGFSGTIKTLTLSHTLHFRAVEKDSEKAPDFRIYAGKEEIEVGAGWQKTSREGHDYVSVKLDDPTFPAPVYPNLSETDEAGTYKLVWSR